MSTGKNILTALRQQLNLSDYRKKHWEGSFEEYLDIVREHPEVTRTAYQHVASLKEQPLDLFPASAAA